MAEKRYYWLKLQEDFFSSKRIKKLRKIAGGDTYTIIYLKMQLLSIQNGGILKYTGLESSFAEELALDLDEEVENVAVTLQFLLSCGLIETSDNIEFLLPYAVLNTGSEGSSAKRVRDFRERQKALPCNTDVTQVKQIGNGEKEIEIEIEKEIDKKNIRFVPPTVDEVAQYCKERNNGLDAEAFVAFYESKGWKIGKETMKNWKSAVITWEKRRKQEQTNNRNTIKAHEQYLSEGVIDLDADDPWARV